MLRALLVCCFLSSSSLLAAQSPPPALNARVTDLTATLSREERGQLENQLAAFERWKLGRKGIDDDVLLVVAKADRQLRTEVGYGLEGALNDATAKRIIDETITPYFKQNDFYGGLKAGVNNLIKVIGGEALPPPKAARENSPLQPGFL